MKYNKSICPGVELRKNNQGGTFHGTQNISRPLLDAII
jgi:hypothetical protein